MATKRSSREGRRRQKKEKRSTRRNTGSPPLITGKVKENTQGLHQKFCPICWSFNYSNVSRSWELPRDIKKCVKCKHHSVRTIMNESNHNTLYNCKLGRHDNIPIELSKRVLVDKKVYTPKVLVVLPSEGIFELIHRVFLDNKSSIKDRRKGIQNKRIIPQFYCVTSPESFDTYVSSHSSLKNTKLITFKNGWKSITGRQIVISEGIKEASAMFGRFDLVVTTDTLSQVLDPSLIIKSIIESCEYFTCIENRYTSSMIKKYTSDLVLLEEQNYFANNKRLIYPIEESYHLQKFVRDQYQYFSSSTLLGAFKNTSINVENNSLPKGKSRSFKVDSLKEMHPHRQVAHNFPSSYVLDL